MSGAAVDLDEMTVFERIEEIAECFCSTLSLHFYGAVGTVSDPSSNIKALGVVICAVSEAYALYMSGKAVVLSINLFHEILDKKSVRRIGQRPIAEQKARMPQA